MTLLTFPRYAAVIYCDDVREETGNKLSYMGIYQAQLVLGIVPPLVLPKFVAVIMYSEPFGDQPEPMTIRVFLPGNLDDEAPNFEIPTPVDETRQIPLVEGANLGDVSRHLTLPLQFAPFPIECFGRLRIHLKRRDDIYRLPALTITGPGDSLVSTVSVGDVEVSS